MDYAAVETLRSSEFRRTMQMLCRFETCFRRASWKSGSGMVFPILFGHLSFTTHRCWTVFMRGAMFLAHEAWRQAYGQLATHPFEDEQLSRPLLLRGALALVEFRMNTKVLRIGILMKRRRQET